MTGRFIAFLTPAIALVFTCGAQAAPVTPDNFQVATTADLVALCSAPQTDPMHTAARNFCEGFAVGTYRMIEIEEAATRAKKKMFCIPSPAPTRDQAVAAFVQWAANRPATLARSPTDGIAEYLSAEYSCK